MKKILLIDDEDDFRSTLATGLSYDGYECLTAKNGKEGLAAALEHTPDLVLCDIYMDSMNGFETLHAFRAHETFLKVPFIFLTAHNETGIMRHGMELGADDFLTKPVQLDEVKAAITARLHRVETLFKQGERTTELMRKRLEEFKTLAEVTKKINAGVLLEDICEEVYTGFKPFIPFNRIGVALIDDADASLVARWAKTESETVVITKGYRQKLSGSSLEQMFISKQPRIINDLDDYYARKPESRSTRDILKEGIRSSLTCPLIAMGKNIGFIFFSSMEKNTYKYEHVEVYTQLAGQLAVVLEKARLYEQLIELNNTKNRFMGIAAHDLRNPLSAIIGFGNILMDEPAIKNDPELQEYVQYISAAGTSALNLINDLLDYAAIESGQLTITKELVNLRMFIAEVMKTHQMFGRSKNITISAEQDHTLPDGVEFDRARIRQVLDNFLSNALKYSHPDTHVTVRLLRQGALLRCEVTDQGQGIPQHELKDLFKEYSRTSVLPTGGEKSTGLGLAIAKKIIKEHGGEVGATSVEGKGSTFFFLLPLSEA
jgi:signal transduction histidine kinase/DNA-binding NarL/FixJ family response regulator